MRATTSILHIVDTLPEGQETRHLAEVVRGIAESAVACGMTSGSQPEDNCVSSITVLRIPHLRTHGSFISHIRAFIELSRVIKKFAPSLIHTHGTIAGRLGRIVPGDYARVHTFDASASKLVSGRGLRHELRVIIEKLLANRSELLITEDPELAERLRGVEIGLDQDWAVIPMTSVHEIIAAHSAAYESALNTLHR